MHCATMDAGAGASRLPRPSSRYTEAHDGAFSWREEADTMGTRTITSEYPDELLHEVDERRLAALAREAFVVKLYEQGLIGSGKGAKMLGISRRDFLDLVGTYNVSIFDENVDFDEELRRA